MLRCNHKKISSDVHLSTPADNFLLERLASALFQQTRGLCIRSIEPKSALKEVDESFV